MNALPTSKLERWKYSNLPAFIKDDYTEEPLAVGYDGDHKYIIQNDEKSHTWAQETHADMDLWNDLQDILNLHIPNDGITTINLATEIEKQTKSVGHIHITLESNAQAVIYDHQIVEGWCNRAVTITLNENAQLSYIRTGVGQGIVTNLTQIQQAQGSKFKSYALNNYGSFVRDQIHTKLNGENIECYLSGTKILDNKQHCDTTILIDHMAPNCYSNQNYRNVLKGQSRGVFQGKVYVDQIAQQTDGYQLCNTVMLSDKCEMDTKPELEIYADDVKCSHGATTAQLDADPLFYLQARGIPIDQARNILLQSFVNESLELFEEEEDIYDGLSTKIINSLGQ
jgi:Fe-S cluster assembly protein SufD